MKENDYEEFIKYCVTGNHEFIKPRPPPAVKKNKRKILPPNPPLNFKKLRKV
jgi:hypothetical protein